MTFDYDVSSKTLNLSQSLELNKTNVVTLAEIAYRSVINGSTYAE